MLLLFMPTHQPPLLMVPSLAWEPKLASVPKNYMPAAQWGLAELTSYKWVVRGNGQVRG
jgi:hypothetical protein